MKKKIIYFCVGVLLTSLILIAWQVMAAAPNPGHDEFEITYLNMTKHVLQYPSEMVTLGQDPPGTCDALCDEITDGSSCVGAYCPGGYNYWDAALCSATGCIGGSINNCQCQMVGYYMVLYK